MPPQAMRSRRYYVVTMSNYPVVAISVLVFRANTPSPSDYRGLRERRELPHRGPGAALPGAKRIWYILTPPVGSSPLPAPLRLKLIL